jgi:hypothetical protein
MVEQHPGVHRLWSLMREDEECVGAALEGQILPVVDDVLPEPFVATLSFAQLGPPVVRTEPDGRRFDVRPILGKSEKHRTHGQRCRTIDAAMAWLDLEKVRLLQDGWIETPLDPVADPD